MAMVAMVICEMPITGEWERLDCNLQHQSSQRWHLPWLQKSGSFITFNIHTMASSSILWHIAVLHILVICYNNQWVHTINAETQWTITTIVELGNFVVFRSRSSGPTRWSSWRIFLSRLPVSKVLKLSVNVIRRPFNQSLIKIYALWAPYTKTHFIIIIGLTEYFLVPYYRCRFEMTGTSVNPHLNCTEYNTVVGVQTTP